MTLKQKHSLFFFSPNIPKQIAQQTWIICSIFRILIVTFTLTIVVDETQHSTEQTLKKFIEKNSYSDWIVMASFHSNLTVVSFQNFIDDLTYNWTRKEQNKKIK